jgi:hypothetical protein
MKKQSIFGKIPDGVLNIYTYAYHGGRPFICQTFSLIEVMIESID